MPFIAAVQEYVRQLRATAQAIDRWRYCSKNVCHDSCCAADEPSWVKDGATDAIPDNLYADKKTIPMIVVKPNGKMT
jgi:hypothetical protein